MDGEICMEKKKKRNFIHNDSRCRSCCYNNNAKLITSSAWMAVNGMLSVIIINMLFKSQQWHRVHILLGLCTYIRCVHQQQNELAVVRTLFSSWLTVCRWGHSKLYIFFVRCSLRSTNYTQTHTFCCTHPYERNSKIFAKFVIYKLSCTACAVGEFLQTRSRYVHTKLPNLSGIP